MQTLEIPIFTLNTVLYPDSLLPLKIFEQRYMDMAKACMKDHLPFGVCLIQAGEEVGAPATPHAVGTLARIINWDMPQLGILQITARGEQRFLIEDSKVGANGLISAQVSVLSQETAQSIPAEYAACQDVLRHIIEELGESHFTPLQMDNATWVGYRLAEALPIKSSARQDLLEMNDGMTRLKILLEFLKRQGLAER
ncbi:LON peptidase substrate-binding domain-containing protein [Sulfuriferula multivorans]|uniref:LON peptidase substrate-binding domain-containing protein n=1 Tax=Sulfuriferula multivorans TaxID=1559896 RepID=UPI001CB9B623|nr:LON peptidase substrate-binding domain-containing protein [Sulfuriferula multivorans]